MENSEFRKYAHDIVDWIADYFENIKDYPVKSQVAPGDIYKQLPGAPPLQPENFEEIFRDFTNIIMPGMTHWQHPNFFAYFPANNSEPSILGEMLTAALGAQCMVWQTSPAAAELEEMMMNWLRDMISLPDEFTGVIQDTASTSTLCSILTAREKYSDYKINRNGAAAFPDFKIYCSAEAHSSIEKAVKIAGLGKDNMRKIPVDSIYAMDVNALEAAISDDIAKGSIPLCVVAALGTTSSTAIDPIKEIGEICAKYNIWFHIDAAFAGTALILPEIREKIEGIELADTFVFNPHKWMFTNFDCSAYFVKDKEALIRTFEIMPEYLKTKEDAHVNNYRDWGIQLGRRFRALKLWFVIRSYGVDGLRAKVREHIELAKELEVIINNDKDFEILAPRNFNILCFRFKPGNINDEEKINTLNEEILSKVNSTGKAYITHTKLNGKFTLRFVIAQTHVTKNDVMEGWSLIKNMAKSGGK